MSRPRSRVSSCVLLTWIPSRALGGQIIAKNGSHIDLSNDTFLGGTLQAEGSGAWVLGDSSTVLDGSTDSGAVTIVAPLELAGGLSLTLKGTIHNEKGIDLNGQPALEIDPAKGGVTLDSGGAATPAKVVLDDSANAIRSLGAQANFTNVDNVISGAGTFSNLIYWEIPRLCRGGSRSLTFPAVCAPQLAVIEKADAWRRAY